MKNVVNIVVAFVFLLGAFFSTAIAQQLSDENTYVITQYFQQNNTTSEFLKDKVSPAYNLKNQINLVKLSQVGNANQIDIKSSGGDTQIVSQFGNNNDYNFINFYNRSKSNFNIVQEGNSNSLQIYGENSLIKNISIYQKANFETLIIKNY